MDKCSRVTIEGWPLESGADAHTSSVFWTCTPRPCSELPSRVVYVCHTKVLFGARIWQFDYKGKTKQSIRLVEVKNWIARLTSHIKLDVYDLQEKVFSVGNNLFDIVWGNIRFEVPWQKVVWTKSGSVQINGS